VSVVRSAGDAARWRLDHAGKAMSMETKMGAFLLVVFYINFLNKPEYY
jgi:hypothetical protein